MMFDVLLFVMMNWLKFVVFSSVVMVLNSCLIVVLVCVVLKWFCVVFNWVGFVVVYSIGVRLIGWVII